MYVAQIKTGSGYYDILLLLLLLLLLLHTRFLHKNCAKDYGTTLQDLQLPTPLYLLYWFTCSLMLTLPSALSSCCSALAVAYE